MEKREFDVICIGFAAQDIVMTGIPENALEQDSVSAREVLVTSGGDANNQAVILGRLGSRTALLAKLGTDIVSDSIYWELQQEKTDLSLIQRKQDVCNLLAVCVCRDDGQRSFLLHRGKGYHWSSGEIPNGLLARTRAISLGSLFNLGELDIGGAENLFKRAKEENVITIADMTADIEHIGPDKIQGIYPFTDYLLPSFREAAYITGEKSPERMAEFFLNRGVKNVAVKLGEKGCYFKNLKEEFYMQSFRVPVVDTTGCGDNFVAGFIHQILKGKSMKEAAEFACAAGAINATVPGAHHAVISEKQVLELINKMKR